MQYRDFGRTGWKVSTIGFGAWAIGGTWGKIDDKESLAALHKAVDLGVNFFDTADVYGDGHSERLLAKLKKESNENIYIVTKAGRRLNPHVAKGYNKKNIGDFIDRSLKNLEMETLDLVQLHCPPTEVYYMPEVFSFLDDFVREGKIRFYGVSVEKVEEAIKAVEYPNVQSVQIIFNMFRQRPSELFFSLARKHKTGILARVPLASGLLTGKMDKSSHFEKDDHRNFNRQGESFDKGETFSGVDFELGLKAVEELKKICPPDMSMTQFALRWVLMFNEVSCAIPGARKPAHVEDNIAAADLRSLNSKEMEAVKQIYNQYIKETVHHLW